MKITPLLRIYLVSHKTVLRSFVYKHGNQYAYIPIYYPINKICPILFQIFTEKKNGKLD